jgi:hypothetical protein
VLLSFDGLYQERARKKGSFAHVFSVMEKLRDSDDINLMTNSTFTAETVGHLSKSIPFIIESHIPTVNLSFSLQPPWNDAALSRLRDELSSLREYSLSFYEKSGTVPISCFRKDENRAVYGCHAGKNRMALSPDGKLWGCFQFYDFFRNHKRPKVENKYCFGSLESFIDNQEKVYPEILDHYSGFRMDNFFTSQGFCFRCKELEDCFVCPVDAAIGDSIIRKVPDWFCEIKKIIRKEKQNFLRDLKSSN